MIKVVGVNIPNDKRLDISLTYIKGIGRKTAKDIRKHFKYSILKKTSDLSSEEIFELSEFIQKKYLIENELITNILNNIHFLINNGSYRGIRHSEGLPQKGRTHTNAATHKKYRSKHTSFYLKTYKLK